MGAYIGIDVGTQGARAVAVRDDGTLLGTAQQAFPPESWTQDGSGKSEQDPRAWWDAVGAVCSNVMDQVRSTSGDIPVKAVGVTSTSGTLVPVAEDGGPLGPAIMYSDRRGAGEAERLNEAAADYRAKVGSAFSASSSLAKALMWWHEVHDPRLRWFLSPTDYLNACLTGRPGTTDFTNALKMGYDIVDLRWPEFIFASTPLPRKAFPEVLAPGDPVGGVSSLAALHTGIPAGTPVIHGLTDGCASQFAAGAVAVDDWNATLGTTLVIKGVTEAFIRDPEGRIYSHRHPVSGWLPGGAGNVGAAGFPLDPKAPAPVPRQPGSILWYPLGGVGERFPFRADSAKGFACCVDPATNGAKASRVPASSPAAGESRAVAYMEGVAYVERMAFSLMRHFGARIAKGVRAAGGASKNNAWMQVRANVTGLPYHRPVHSGAAMGIAVLAAGRTGGEPLEDVARRFVTFERSFEPDLGLHELYLERYERFLAELSLRGYITDSAPYAHLRLDG